MAAWSWAPQTASCTALTGWLHREQCLLAHAEYLLCYKSGWWNPWVPQSAPQLGRARVRIGLLSRSQNELYFVRIKDWKSFYILPPLFKYLVYLQCWKIALILKHVRFCNYEEKTNTICIDLTFKSICEPQILFRLYMLFAVYNIIVTHTVSFIQSRPENIRASLFSFGHFIF